MRKNWLKLISLFLVISLFAVHLTACGGDKAESAAPADSAAESTAESAPEEEAEPAAAEEDPSEPDESVDDTDVEEIEEANASEPEEAESPAEEAPAEAETDERGEYFVLSYFSMGGEEYTEDILSAMKAGYMVFRNDGTGEINIMGNVIDMTWDASTVTSSGQSLPYDRDGDVIHFEQVNDEDGSLEVMEFTKRDWPSEEEGEEAGEPAPLDYDPSTRAGFYDIETMSDANGNVATAAQLKALEMEFYLVFNEDGTGRFVVMGIDMPITYDDSKILVYGQPLYDYDYNEGRIAITYEGNTLNFAYAGTPDKAPAEEEAGSEDADAEDLENALDSVTEEVEAEENAG